MVNNFCNYNIFRLKNGYIYSLVLGVYVTTLWRYIAIILRYNKKNRKKFEIVEIFIDILLKIKTIL